MRWFVPVLMFIASLAGPALAKSEAPLWTKVGVWQIRVDPTVGNGCFAVSVFQDGSLFRVGFDMESGHVYVIFGNNSWKSIEVGKEYSLTFKFDRESPWSGAATGTNFADGGHPFLTAVITDPKFLSEFARKNVLSIHYQRSEIARLSLRGSQRALKEMFLCQQAMAENGTRKRHSKRDPFAGGSNRPASDPFL